MADPRSNMKRAKAAHITTVQTLFDFYVEEIFLECPIEGTMCRVICVKHPSRGGNGAANYAATLEHNKVQELMAEFDKKEAKNSLFKFV